MFQTGTGIWNQTVRNTRRETVGNAIFLVRSRGSRRRKPLCI